MEDEKIKEKKELRKKYITAREGLSEAESESVDSRIVSNILGSGFYRDARSVFIYISVDREVNTALLTHKAFEDGKTVFVPRTRDNRVMEAVRVEAEEFLKRARTEWPRRYNIPEPPDDIPASEMREIDLLIAPSLLLDRFGYRLGYGGGFYDHFIKNARAQKNRLLIAAVQRSIFVSDEALPREPYDMPVDIIVTEKGIVIPSSSRTV